MKSAHNTIENENDFSNVIIVIGIAITLNILCTSMGIDISDTASHIASNFTASL